MYMQAFCSCHAQSAEPQDEVQSQAVPHQMPFKRIKITDISDDRLYIALDLAISKSDGEVGGLSE